MAKDKYTRQDAKNDTDASNKEAKAAWHTARDDSGRNDDYSGGLRDPILKDNLSNQVSQILQNSGITDIQSQPSTTST